MLQIIKYLESMHLNLRSKSIMEKLYRKNVNKKIGSLYLHKNVCTNDKDTKNTILWILAHLC